jgi:hypothetical protein
VQADENLYPSWEDLTPDSKVESDKKNSQYKTGKPKATTKMPPKIMKNNNNKDGRESERAVTTSTEDLPT